MRVQVPLFAPDNALFWQGFLLGNETAFRRAGRTLMLPARWLFARDLIYFCWPRLGTDVPLALHKAADEPPNPPVLRLRVAGVDRMCHPTRGLCAAF